MTDYDETRARRSRTRPAAVKPDKQYIFYTCEHCGHSCTLEAPTGWSGTYYCSHCGGQMKQE